MTANRVCYGSIYLCLDVRIGLTTGV